MDEALVFYTHPMSRGQTVRWMLEEVGEPYSTEVLAYGGSMKSPEYLAINPMGKVPAISHRGRVVTEGAAICAYLADAFPAAGLAPAPDSPDRAPYYRWLFFAAGPLEAAITNRAAKFELRPEHSRMMSYGTFEAAVDAVEAAVQVALDGSGFLAGERFSAADLFMGAQLAFTMRFGVLEKRPAFERFVAGLDGRAARQRAQAIDADLIAQAQGG